MLQFQSDYLEGAHPRVLARLSQTNLEQTPGYGVDAYCCQAAEYIKHWVEAPLCDVHFLVGGTQANATVIDACLKPYQGVLAADRAHIAAHETGAIEAAGHKVLALPTPDGKLKAAQLEAFVQAHLHSPSHEHEVQPGMVYLSQPTETGLLYTLSELQAISAVCRQSGLYLYIDGARLGYGLASEQCDMKPSDLPKLCDAFTVGGTKQGLLFGEAVVLQSPALQKDFRYLIKQHGGMLAKGRLLGLQFAAMFEDDLYLSLSREADRLAMLLRRSFEALQLPLYFDSYTNQQFPILPDEVLDKLSEGYCFEEWVRVDSTHRAVRFCTGWATTEAAVQKLLEALKALL